MISIKSRLKTKHNHGKIKVMTPVTTFNPFTAALEQAPYVSEEKRMDAEERMNQKVAVSEEMTTQRKAVAEERMSRE